MYLHFYKYQGAGNDFIILDNRDGQYSKLAIPQIYKLCNRNFGIGADGLMMLDLHPEATFEMKYYNADGKEGSMCGNGGRCIVAFAHKLGLVQGDKVSFKAIDGMHEAVLTKPNWVELKMSDVSSVEFGEDFAILDTGSPHYVKYTEYLGDVDVVKEGRAIRNSKDFAKEGINVNFIEYGPSALLVRTYERGVENETMACGTGVTAAALVVAGNQNKAYSIPVKTNGGSLEVRFDKKDQQHYENIWLCGPADYVFQGEIALGAS